MSGGSAEAAFAGPAAASVAAIVLPVRVPGRRRTERNLVDGPRPTLRPVEPPRAESFEDVARRVQTALSTAFPDDLVAVVARATGRETVVLLQDPDERPPLAALDLARHLRAIDLTQPPGDGAVPLVVGDRIGVRLDVDGDRAAVALFVLRRRGTLTAADVESVDGAAALARVALRTNERSR